MDRRYVPPDSGLPGRAIVLTLVVVGVIILAAIGGVWLNFVLDVIQER